ncbi:MAG: TolC family protein [Planctomycetota bacterium]|jgi:cobalt-zinc-cadmium efflux system outer membrane protein
MLARVRAERQRPASQGPLTLSEATANLRRHNPAIRRARAEARVAQALACTPTPWSNPTLELGPLLFGDADVLTSGTLGFTSALGWEVPLADTRGLQDEVHAVRASAAFTEAAAVEREQYLLLRGEYVALILLTDLAAATEALFEAAEASQEIAQKAVEAGAATALDVRLLGLEAGEIRAEWIAAEESTTEARGRLAARMGVASADATAPPPSDLPPLPAAVPALEVLHDTVIRHHPRLAALRAQYLVAEKELRLEVARRYPPLGFAFTYEKEDENYLGLPLSIEIPIFDRNQQGVAEASARRQALREQYAAALNEILAEVEQARARVEARRRRLSLYASQLEAAEETQQIAETVLRQTGTFDMLRYLEVLRATRRPRVEYRDARAGLYEGWSDLEQACGAPLLRFGTEPGREAPAPVASPDGDER